MQDVGSSGAHETVDSDRSIAPSSDRASGGGSSFVVWVLASCFSVAVLAVGAAHAPARVRLIGLFSVGFGLIVGWPTVRLAQIFEVQPVPRSAVVLASLLAITGFAVSTWQTFKLDEQTQKKTKEEELAASLMREFDRQQGVTTVDEAQLPSPKRFQRYLSRRVKQLGEWLSPWPELFWSTEVLLAGVAAGWLTYRLITQTPNPQPSNGALK